MDQVIVIIDLMEAIRSMLSFTLFLNPPHFLKDILHILNTLYITSVPDVERVVKVTITVLR